MAMKLLRTLLILTLVMPAFIMGSSNAASRVTAKDVVWSEENARGKIMHLYLFWSKDCAHCHDALPFAKQLNGRYPWIRVHLTEVTNNQQNLSTLNNMASALGEAGGQIPAFFFCRQMYAGWGAAETTGQWIVDTLKECRAS